MGRCHLKRGPPEEGGGVRVEDEVGAVFWLCSACLVMLVLHFIRFTFTGRSRPLRGLRRSRQERHSKDASKLLMLYDENILDNDPYRESKDVAFAQSYLNRVRRCEHNC